MYSPRFYPAVCFRNGKVIRTQSYRSAGLEKYQTTGPLVSEVPLSSQKTFPQERKKKIIYSKNLDKRRKFCPSVDLLDYLQKIFNAPVPESKIFFPPLP
jgi:hypothetical protein